MIKHVSLAAILAIVTCLTACHKSPETLAEMKHASEADSLMYYFGQMQAKNYWKDGVNDTLLRTEEGREDFVEGFRHGLEYTKSNRAYNRGLQEGIRLAMRLKELEGAYSIHFPKDVLANSVELAMQDEDAFDVAEAQTQFYKIKDRLDLQRGVREGETARADLAKAAAAQDFTMINDSLYYQKITEGTGPLFINGDKISLYLTTSKVDGTPIGKQFPPRITLGEGRVPQVVREALYTMNDGETCSFMTIPQSIFGKTYDRYRLNSNEVLVFTIRAERLSKKLSVDNTPPAVY